LRVGAGSGVSGVCELCVCHERASSHCHADQMDSDSKRALAKIALLQNAEVPIDDETQVEEIIAADRLVLIDKGCA
jgi:hypothetical protein